MFKYVVLGSAIFIASCAAFFSVTGIAQLFSGHMLTVALAAISMEVGKVVSVSLLYRHRRHMSRMLRVSLTSILIMLIGVTSFGIYAYLASSYADSASGVKGKENIIALYTTQQTNIVSDITRLTQRATQLQASRAQQENRLDSLIAKGRSITGQQAIIRSQDAEIIDIQKQIRTMASTRDSLANQVTSTTNSLSTDGKMGTFYYVAKAIGVPLDTIVKWFILVLIVVFDPLSVSLFFGYNVILEKETISESAQDDETRASSPPKESEPLEDSSDSSVQNVSELALLEEKPLAKSENITVELDKTQYFMRSDYNWKTDHRWHTDPSAQMYLSRLGIDPTA